MARTLTTCMISVCNACIFTPSRATDPRCDARITLKRSLATDLTDDDVVDEELEVLPAPMSFPTLLRNDMKWYYKVLRGERKNHGLEMVSIFD